MGDLFRHYNYFLYYLYITCNITHTFAQHFLLDNILELSFMHDEHNLTFDKQLHNLDRRLRYLRK